MLAGTPEMQGQFLAALASGSVFLAGRERSKTNIIRVIHEVRVEPVGDWAPGRRTGRPRRRPATSACCSATRCTPWHRERSVALASWWPRRREHLDWLGSLEPPFLINSPPPSNTTWPKRGANKPPIAGVGDVLAGLPGCSGVARGRARVVLHPSDPSALEPGDVLIAPMTDPAWTPLFVPAAGVVVNVGAPLSHAIIVSRVLGIPCVVSVNEATDRIPDGALVEVNGDTGTVTVLELP